MRACRALWCNVTSRTNAARSTEHARKWGGDAKQGIPHRPRSDMSKITIIHETRNVLIAGRNRCNNFNSNQYMLVGKASNEGVLIDMADDWPDDWVGFIENAGITLRCIFFTHLHVDNIIGLPPFLHLLPDTRLAWNYAERYWAQRFPHAAQRYGRSDMANAWLPFVKPLVSVTTDTQHILLSSESDRMQSFMTLGDLHLQTLHTPGHSTGHMMLHVPQERLLFSGDTLLHDEVGRVDLPQASGRHQAQSLRMLEDLPDNTAVLPGHGQLTTMARERKENRFLRRLYAQIEAGAQELSCGLNNSGPL